MGALGLGLWLMVQSAAAPPPPEPPKPPPLPPADPTATLDRDAWILAEWMVDTAERISAEYVRPVRSIDLLETGLTEIYRTAGLELPTHFRDRLRNANGMEPRMRVIQMARLALGSVEAADGTKSVLIAAKGFGKLTDPYCGPMATRGSTFASSDAEFGLGFELEGATGSRWMEYLLDSATTPDGRMTTNRTTSPAEVPWIVKRVLPGGPAAKAGLRPGDVITHIGPEEVTVRSNSRAFRTLMNAFPTDAMMPDVPPDPVRPISLTISRRGRVAPMTLKLERTAYRPESIFGVIRRPNGTWDYLLDPQAKIGYIRVGSVELGADAAFQAALQTLIEAGAKGLVLDLRWCPGGYVEPTTRIAGFLLPEDAVIATVKYRHPDREGTGTIKADAAEGREAFLRLPVVVLVGPDTAGGGEMIAAALQDHNRAKLVGQRTFGKANVMNLIGTRIRGMSYRVSTGYSYRPSGVNRHRFPDSKPTDVWGLRPDPGCELPMTADLYATLRQDAELQAIRPPDDFTAVAFDDPLNDPQKLIAVKLLKK